MIPVIFLKVFGESLALRWELNTSLLSLKSIDFKRFDKFFGGKNCVRGGCSFSDTPWKYKTDRFFWIMHVRGALLQWEKEGDPHCKQEAYTPLWPGWRRDKNIENIFKARRKAVLESKGNRGKFGKAKG